MAGTDGVLFLRVCRNGCRQLIQDQLPERKSQLYNTYGPGGSIPLIPAAQSGSPPLTIKTVDTSDGAGQYVQIFNGNPVAVDVSGYKLQGSTSITLRQGGQLFHKCPAFQERCPLANRVIGINGGSKSKRLRAS